ncbi:hypothetical protein PENSPDRAFT_651721 [Peniophora sp. CONT]|nr:hypothetical protein PENSPDRAFT_651721 [Peniophora sp. CONT]
MNLEFEVFNPLPEERVGLCATCHKWGAPLRCSRCKGDAYCNAECQGKDWKEHKKYCSKPDPAKAKERALIQKTVNAVPELLDLSQRLSPHKLTRPGNKYLQTIVDLACVLNGITTAKDSADIAALDLRFEHRITRPDLPGNRHTVLQLRTAMAFTKLDFPLLVAPDTLRQRASADAMLHALMGVRGDPTCCHIPLVFGSDHPSERMNQASHVQFFFVPVLPGVAKKAVQEMLVSGLSMEDYIGELIEKFNRMIIHDEVCGTRGVCTCSKYPMESRRTQTRALRV